LVNSADVVDENGRVQVRVLAGGDGPEVRVSDDGPGIADQDVPRLFSERFTTKRDGRGSGLGLHVARTVMERSGGSVRLVPPGDAQRLPWARTEFAVCIARMP
jgi:two-component system, NtrC family, sensor kinase